MLRQALRQKAPRSEMPPRTWFNVQRPHYSRRPTCSKVTAGSHSQPARGGLVSVSHRNPCLVVSGARLKLKECETFHTTERFPVEVVELDERDTGAGNRAHDDVPTPRLGRLENDGELFGESRRVVLPVGPLAAVNVGAGEAKHLRSY
jgi:hypothetical protein